MKRFYKTMLERSLSFFIIRITYILVAYNILQSCTAARVELYLYLHFVFCRMLMSLSSILRVMTNYLRLVPPQNLTKI